MDTDRKDPDTDLDIGRAIARLRLRAALTQAELGALAGLSGPAISWIENARRRPSWRTVHRIHAIFKAKLGILLIRLPE